ncbi:MAG: ATP-binding cassette domain-containing protein [Acetobacteraceae bacterium]|nr:ATP-binding cassette domain-containing protein [Acetobacteraceae bacterium]
MTGPILPRQAAWRRARRALTLGVALALFVTVFVDIAILAVPIYDMQLYDRVLLSRNMDTVAMLSVACGTGLVIYGVLDFLRSATLVAISDQVGRALGAPVLEAGVWRSVGGDASAGGEAMRDLNEIRGFLSSGAVSAPLDALCAPLLLAVMFMLHPAFGWLGVAGVSLLTIVGVVTDALVRPAVTAAAQERSQAANQLAAGLREADLTEGLGMAPALSRRWARRHAAALGRMRQAGHRSDHVAAAAKVARLAMQAGVMALGAVLILSREASAGSLMGANLLLGKVLGPFDALVSSWRRWIAAWAAWRRVAALLARPDAPSSDDAVPIPGELGLVLRDVCFHEPRTGRALLQDVTLDLAPGTATALIGANGAGKSTLLRLMIGLLSPSSGRVRLGGIPVAASDRSRIGYLPQGVHLLDGTVWENVARFEDEATESVIAATTAAGVHEIVGRLRQGYETRIGQGAPTLSGGQRQRIGLARALHGVPLLLALDEPDASLDQAGEAALLQAISAARAAGAVVVIVTHRPHLLARMDLVVTVRDGRIASVAPPSKTEAPGPAHVRSVTV